MKLNWRAIPAKFRNLRVEFAVLIFLLLTGCASLKQCAYRAITATTGSSHKK